MRIFNKLVFICNLCCILAAIMRLVEMAKKSGAGRSETVSVLPPVQQIVVILGYGAIFINLIFVLTWFILLLQGKKVQPAGIAWFNIIMLPVQVWYFFFSKF